MIYTTGTIAINGNTVKGTGTNFSAPLSLIRVGCTLIAISNPIQIFTVTEIKSGTELSVTPAANPAIAAGAKFSILLSDSISVDGLAQDVAETLRFYQEKEDEISSAIDGSNIGLGPEPRDCADISGDPSSYVGFLRIKETTKGFPSVAAGESFLSGFICQRDTVPSYTGVFVGWATRSLYTYTWVATSGANWTRHAKKNEVDRLVQRTGETRVCSQNANKFLTVYDSGSWGCFDSEASKYIPLSISAGGTGAGNEAEARKNLMVMHDAKTTLSDSQNLDDLKGNAAGFYHQSLSVNAKPELNYPIQLAGSLLVQRTGANGSDGCIQKYFVYNNSSIFYARTHTSTQGWTAWKKIVLIERVEEGESTTYVYSKYLPEAPRLQVSTSGLWGCHNGSGWVPLSLSQGGTGALTASDARNNLNLGESNAVKFKNLTLAEALDANLGVLVKTGRDWNTQHTDNIQKFIPMAGSTNGPAGAMVLGGFHAQYSTNYAVQFGGRNSGFWGRTIENGTVQEWRQLATLNTSGQKWTAGQHFVTTKINSYDFTRRLTIDVIENAKTNARLRLWGSETRQSVLEYGLSNAETDEYNTYGFYCQLNPDGVISFQVNGVVNCTAVNQTSDRDLKDNIQVIGDATEAIRKMNGYTYTLKENGLPYAGVIAQEVMEALPEAVGSFTHYGKALQGPTTDGNELREETRYLNVDYAAVTGLLVQVARETDNRVTELEEENASLRANIAVMDERITKLEALVRQLTGSEE
ncbi:L-shaped tail fiber protein [Escherichia coli]|uniref:pyocin knob domain-containing S74 family peptidase n=1 Tax=Escherichia coli TaxID=562 RepID=UPI0006A0C5EC|nr:pyocin knob domain-containing S74 family peptidase [Escherichia coli]CTU76975.1 L-shaped tail fiber protein [Escherichia coli]CTV97459.1 L-shaped tail fiber protein [Escherichia coli]CTX36550.1 L-shaped tail fiber protein [Escherichia coli]CTX68804.1 L-shaped tail fiber protein [Escherichia coli]CTY54977.1 L-shaped tail fiber protein [Escherichia coli]